MGQLIGWRLTSLEGFFTCTSSDEDWPKAGTLAGAVSQDTYTWPVLVVWASSQQVAGFQGPNTESQMKL